MRILTALSIVALLLVACSPTRPTPSFDTTFTGIYGRVTDPSGLAIPGAVVYAYRNPDSGLRGPADFAANVDAEGNYLLDLAPGSFHLVARLRKGGSDSGPPRPGDAWALPAANPVVLADQQKRQLDFTLQPIGEQRVIANTLTSAPFSFTGRILTPQGQALDAAIVLAYRQPQLHRRPDFAASPAGADGRFTLYLPDAGPWCLIARQHTRGQLRASELYALLGHHGDACQLEAETQRDLGDIRLEPFSGQ